MAVVFHHIGRPRNSTISQKEIMTQVRLLISESFSGGASLRPIVVVLVVLVVLSEASFGRGAAGLGSVLSSAEEVGGAMST